MNYDQRFISYALNLAKKNLGLTAPNPVVGAVVVLDGEIIASGVTAKGGRPHAEVIALELAMKKVGAAALAKAVLYVTLEPCHEKTTACANVIIQSGIRRVVVATRDPNPAINGNGIKKLLAHGIEVVENVAEEKARELNKAFFKSQTRGIPYVTLKLATSLDGKIATKTFASKWITSEKAREFGHYLRAINDAIVIGASTLRLDDPLLNCRIPGLEDHSPIRVVIGNKPQLLNPELKIFQTTAQIPTWILTGEQQFDFSEFKKTGTKIFLCKTRLDQAGSAIVDLTDALKILHQNQINSLLVEGGSKLATEFIRLNLVDELVLIRSNKIIGSDGISAIGELNVEAIEQALSNFKRSEVREIGEEVVEIYRGFVSN